MLGGGAFMLVRRRKLSDARLREEALSAEVAAISAIARAEAAATVSSASAEAREKLLDARRASQDEAHKLERELQRREDELARREITFSAAETRVIARAAAVAEREQGLKAFEATRRQHDDERKRVEGDVVRRLEQIAGEARGDLRERLIGEWVTDAKARAADELRRIDQGLADAEHGREAKRVMGIAIQRYQGHYLTERLLSNLPLVPGLGARLTPDLPAIEEVANIKLTLADDQSSVRLEGQDSFGREIARRYIRKLEKHGTVKGKGDAKSAVEKIKEDLEREVVELGRRAFKELEIPRAHPDIVKLVGRLNYRTSYTQNQWKHAVEAAFLCGMMAAELGLDVKLARRAALMHDIGKALTHEHRRLARRHRRRLRAPPRRGRAGRQRHRRPPRRRAVQLGLRVPRRRRRRHERRAAGRAPRADRQLRRRSSRTWSASAAASPASSAPSPCRAGARCASTCRRSASTTSARWRCRARSRTASREEMTFPGQIKVTVIRELRAVEVAG